MDAATRKRALDAVTDGRNSLALQIHASSALDREKAIMLEALEGMYRSAKFGMGDDGSDPVFPTLQSKVKR